MSLNQLPNLKVNTRRGTWQKGMTDQNQLLNAMVVSPEINKAIKVWWNKKYFMSFFVENIFTRPGSLKDIGNNTYQWAIQEYSKRPNKLLSSTPGVGTKAGEQGQEVILEFEENLFSEGHTIRAPFSDVILRINSPGYVNGSSGYCYRCTLVSRDPFEFIPDIDLTPGTLWTIAYSAFEEGSSKGTEAIVGPSYFMENQTTILRMMEEVTGSAASDIVSFEFNVDGKSFKTWVHYKIWVAMEQWQRQIEHLYWFGRNNKRADSTVGNRAQNGRIVRTGSGLIEQISGGFSMEYRTFNSRLLDTLLEYANQRNKDIDNAELIIVGGYGAMVNFHNAIESKFRNYNIISDNLFISKQDGNKLKAGFQYNKYEGLNGATIKFAYNPVFDDPNEFTAIDPGTGRPYASNDFYLLNVGDYAGSPNISLFQKAGNGYNRGMVSWYEGGGVIPGGSGQSGSASGMFDLGSASMRSNSKDAYTYHWLTERMLVVQNPQSCGIIKYNPF
jgi:hypothetical protein